MNLFSRLGFAAQVAAIFISSYVVFCGQYLGFITLLTSLVTDFVSPFRRASSFNTLIKFFLFVQTLLVYIFLTQTVGHQLRSDLSSSQRQQPIGVKLYDSTYTLPNKYSLSSRVPLIWKKKQQSTDRNGIDGGGVSGNHVFSGMDSITMDALLRVFHIRQNLPPPDSFPDLIFRNHSEVRSGLQRVFTEIPASGYLTKFKNPCWYKHEHSDQSREDTDKDLSCLPYAYMLGQPKCGTSDLYERLHSHPDVSSPNVKEIRWFTRGEFTVDPLPEENPLTCRHSQQCRLGRESSIYSFTKMLAKAALEIKSRPDDSVISIDGGPHLLWWSTQQPDGSFVPEDIPAVQILRELQPHARFIVTLADPVRRMYSDYWFLNDDRSVRRRDEDTNRKSADQFHDRAVEQIHMFDDCVRRVLKTYENRIILQVGAVNGTWFRAAQICAHDRFLFGRAGWGRLSVGLYGLFLEKWLEHFSLSQFLVTRLEDFDTDKRAYIRRIYVFLGLREPTESEWFEILIPKRFNENKLRHEPMLPATEKLLRDFYAPFNEILASILMDSRYTWRDTQADIKFDKDKILEIAPILWTPATFDTSDLPQGPPSGITDWLLQYIDPKTPPKDLVSAGKQLALAIIALDIPALKYLLKDVGVPVTVVADEDTKQPPFVSLALVSSLAEGHSRSHVFKLLKGERSWISDLMRPPLPDSMHSVHAKDITESLNEAILNVSKWFIRAGADMNATDSHGYSALDRGSIGGLTGLVEVLLVHGVDPNAQVRSDKRTALHWALAYGRLQIARLLVAYGANLHLADAHGSTPIDLLANPGTINAADALLFFNVTQRPVRMINRIIHPELLPTMLTDRNTSLQKYYQGWPGGTGGWGEERLASYQDDMHCDVDQYWADEITGDEIFRRHMLHNAPVLIRGLIHNWPAIAAYAKDSLNQTYGKFRVTVSDIPYAQKFGGTASMEMSLAEYIDEVRNHRILGGQHPWYVFKGHVVRTMEEKSSLVPWTLVPTPSIIQQAFDEVLGLSERTNSDRANFRSRNIFINAQWAFGGEGTGAPVHHHNTAWNALVYGAKKWFLYPPEHQVMSNRQILDYMETDMKEFENRPNRLGFRPKTCVQTAGDVMIVPESWGHGVLNIQESIAVATEVKDALWRIRHGLGLLTSIPLNNNPRKADSSKK